MENTLNHVSPAANAPLVEAFKAENESKASREAKIAAILESKAASVSAMGDIKRAIADYYAEQERLAADTEAGQYAANGIERAADNVADVVCNAVLAGLIDRKTMRRKLGEGFGFKESPKTGKPTSTPNEPGNTIAKRIASVSIALEYAETGTLPDKGGDSLPIIGQDKCRAELEDFLAGAITVRQASERIEKAIRDNRVTVPFELDPAKLLALASKIEAIGEMDETLQEAYAILQAAIMGLPDTAIEE